MSSTYEDFLYIEVFDEFLQDRYALLMRSIRQERKISSDAYLTQKQMRETDSPDQAEALFRRLFKGMEAEHVAYWESRLWC